MYPIPLPQPVQTINGNQWANALLQDVLVSEGGTGRLRQLLDLAGLETLPPGLVDAVLSSGFHPFDIFPTPELFAMRNVPLPPLPPPLILRIRVDPRGHLSCFLAASVLLLHEEARRLPIFLDVGDTLTTPIYGHGGEHVTFSPFFTAALDLAGQNVHAAYVKDVHAFGLFFPRLSALETLVVAAAGRAHAATLVLPPCLISAPATLHTLVVSTYERTPACGTLNLPPSITRLGLFEVQPAVQEALFAALDAQKITPTALVIHVHSADNAGWRDWLRIFGPVLSSLTLQIDYWSPHNYPNARYQNHLDSFLGAVQHSCPSLHRFALSMCLHQERDQTLSFSPSLTLPASLRALYISVFFPSRRVWEAACGGFVNFLQVAARHGGIEDLTIKAHGPKIWRDKETPMSIARAVASFPLRKLSLSLTSGESTTGLEFGDSRSVPFSAWVLPLLSLLPASLEHLGLRFHSRSSILPAVLRTALDALPNLSCLDLDDESIRKVEAVVPVLRELDGVFPLRRVALHLGSLIDEPACQAELLRWEQEVGEAVRSRATWALVRKGIEKTQERRVANGAAVHGLSLMNRLPARPLKMISEMLAYPNGLRPRAN